ncbi:ABC-type branched-subunit amino acid transport system ATPase component [Bradyrhizobium embrapense]
MALLDVNGLQIFYGDLQAVFDMNFTVADGEAVALVGANGAGKSTFLKALVGLNEERKGAVHFDGIDISQMPAEEVSRLGLIMVPEGREAGPYVGCSTCSLSWTSGGGCFRASSPAASSRWRRSAAR